MVELGITRISSKGQIVIPLGMRKGLKAGETLVVISDGSRIILKKASKMDEQLKEDLEFARRTEEAKKKIKSGKGVAMDFDDFIKEMKKW